MANNPLDTNFLDRAIKFAVDAHAGTERRGKGFPYIVHCLEAMAIVATITNDQELLAAAALHDTVEDTDVTADDLRNAFGERVARIVEAESEPQMGDLELSKSWHTRKQAAIDRLANASHDAKIVAMGDKLSNMRAIAHDYRKMGEALWSKFNAPNGRADHEWHYRGLARSLGELADTFAYQEFIALITEVFGTEAGEPPIPKAEPIDLDDYEYAGEGANGTSYNHKQNPDIMLKLYRSDAPIDIIVNELNLSKKVYELGIPSPKPGDFVTDGKGQYGIRFERITDKISFARAVGNEPARVEEFARKFARLCLELHHTHLPKGMVPDIKEVNLKMLEDNPYLTKEEKERVAKFIQDAPEGDTAIHGDLQFGNAIMAKGNSYFIDLGDFACGHPNFDLGMVLLVCCYDDPDFLREVFHMEPETASQFWVYFVKEYYGEDADPDQKRRELLPYCGLKNLIIERNAGIPFPAYRELLLDNI